MPWLDLFYKIVSHKSIKYWRKTFGFLLNTMFFDKVGLYFGRVIRRWASDGLKAVLDNESSVQFSSVQFSCSVMADSATSWITARQAFLSITNSRSPPNPCPLSRWCHPTILSSVVPSPPALNLSQHQGLFKWVSSSHQVAKVLEFQLQHQSFQWIFRTDFQLSN